jgi:hypothetical protein
MKKQIFIISLFIGALVAFLSCKKDSEGQPSISSVNLRFLASDTIASHAADSIVTGGAESSILPGSWIVIKGSNLTNTKHVYINNVEMVLNSCFITSDNIILQIPADVPTIATDNTVPNSVEVVTPEGKASISLIMRPPTPIILSLDNEFALPGTTLTIYGSNFYGVSQVMFPGNIQGEALSVIDANTLTVTVPSGIPDEGGNIVITAMGGNSITKNGARYHETGGIFAGFEGGIDNDFQNWGFSYGIKEISTSTTNPPVPFINGNYMEMTNFDGTTWNTISAPMWWDGNFECVMNVDWTKVLTNIPASTPGSKLALKFELYSKQDWNSGEYSITFHENWDPAYTWDVRLLIWPYWDPVPSKRNPIKTTDWITVTIPFTDMREESASKLGDISDSNELHWFYFNYNQADASGIGSVFKGKNRVGIPVEKFDVFFDNLRVVKIN